jgi:hypothetical protein
MWLPTLDQAADAAKYLSPSQLAKFRDHARELYDSTLHGRPTFLIFGPGGTGKSTIVKYLHTFDLENLPTDYKVSPLLEDETIKGTLMSRVRALPGQPDLFENEFQKHLKEHAKMRRLICVLCFAYGYRSIDPKHATSQGLPQANDIARQEEIDYAKKLLEFLRFKKLERYEIWTIINKHDLWWDEKENVDAFYASNFQPLINDFGQKVGKNNFEHHIFPLCLVRSNLKNRAGNVVKAQSTDYDDTVRFTYLRYFLTYIKGILRRR